MVMYLPRRFERYIRGQQTEWIAWFIYRKVVFTREHSLKYIRSYLVNVSANYKNTFKHLFPYTSLSSDVVNKLECLCISLEIVFVDAHELCYP